MRRVQTNHLHFLEQAVHPFRASSSIKWENQKNQLPLSALVASLCEFWCLAHDSRMEWEQGSASVQAWVRS